MEKTTRQILEEYLDIAYSYREKMQIILVCNVDGLTLDEDDYTGDSITSEYLTLHQYNKILSSLRYEGFDVISYFDEIEFMKDVLERKFNDLNEKKLMVLNSAQKGTKIGRKSLIPAFCDLYNIYYNNSNAYTVSLCRDKYNSGCVLEDLGFPIPKSWLYKYPNGWLLNRKPIEGNKVIIKLNYETSSIGLQYDNIFCYDKSKDKIIESMCKKYKQDIIVQEFIYGYEVECSFIHSKTPMSFPPIGISMKDTEMLGEAILDYDIRKNHPYTFYNIMKNMPQIVPTLQTCTLQAANALNILGLGRIDYRITPQHQFYITDVATNPGYGDFSSTYYIFKELGFSYSEMLAILIGVALGKYTES